MKFVERIFWRRIFPRSILLVLICFLSLASQGQTARSNQYQSSSPRAKFSTVGGPGSKGYGTPKRMPSQAGPTAYYYDCGVFAWKGALRSQILDLTVRTPLANKPSEFREGDRAVELRGQVSNEGEVNVAIFEDSIGKAVANGAVQIADFDPANKHQNAFEIRMKRKFSGASAQGFTGYSILCH